MNGASESEVDDYEMMLATRFERLGKAMMVVGGLGIVISGVLMLVTPYALFGIVGAFIILVEGGRRWQLGRPPQAGDEDVWARLGTGTGLHDADTDFFSGK